MKPVYLISAVCENNGIGLRGGLPWKLKKEMEYFTRMTSATKDTDCLNAVIMGRKTWESIPDKYRPLANRFNVVISKQTKNRTDDNATYFNSVVDAVTALQSFNYENIETIWVIGGYSVYKEALDNYLCDKLFLTKIQRKFECDVFFPEFFESNYQLTQQENVPKELQSENGIEYYFRVFAIWNTIIGSSLLAMPWSVQRAGLAVALILMLFVSTLAVYTAYRLLAVQFLHGDRDIGEVPLLCKNLLGKWAELTARVFSFIIIFGANIVYWILMSNCLYHSVGYFTDILSGVRVTSDMNNSVICPSDHVANATNEDTEKTFFQMIWNLEITVPVFLVIIVAPLLNFKSATFFTKFNSIGTLSVIYLLIFVMIKSLSWGINVDLRESESEHHVNLYETTFFATSGMLPLSLFIHNIVITLMKNNRDQHNNSRDLSIAYVLVVLTYLLIGFTFYICFPLKKSCIEDNMLNNFPDWDVATVIARVFLFFQLLTVYPLLTYMLRIQVFSALNYPSYPSTFYVVFLNLVNITGCVLFAIFLPRIGTIIRFTGAICGFVYIFTLPCLLYIASQKKQRKLNISSFVLHFCIPMIGLVNLVAQFFVSDNYN